MMFHRDSSGGRAGGRDLVNMMDVAAELKRLNSKIDNLEQTIKGAGEAESPYKERESKGSFPGLNNSNDNTHWKR